MTWRHLVPGVLTVSVLVAFGPAAPASAGVADLSPRPCVGCVVGPGLISGPGVPTCPECFGALRPTNPGITVPDPACPQCSPLRVSRPV